MEKQVWETSGSIFSKPSANMTNCGSVNERDSYRSASLLSGYTRSQLEGAQARRHFTSLPRSVDQNTPGRLTFQIQSFGRACPLLQRPVLNFRGSALQFCSGFPLLTEVIKSQDMRDPHRPWEISWSYRLYFFMETVRVTFILDFMGSICVDMTDGSASQTAS